MGFWGSRVTVQLSDVGAETELGSSGRTIGAWDTLTWDAEPWDSEPWDAGPWDVGSLIDAYIYHGKCFTLILKHNSEGNILLQCYS